MFPSRADFFCSICRDVLHKPVVLPCGHTICFWCCFRSMEHYDGSYCPECRSRYIHFPRVCTILYAAVLRFFPEDDKRRQVELKDIENKMKVQAPEVDLSKIHHVIPKVIIDDNSISEKVPDTDACSKYSFDTETTHVIFKCEDPQCYKLINQPIVLLCGHTFCRSCCVKQTAQILKEQQQTQTSNSKGKFSNYIENKKKRIPICHSPTPPKKEGKGLLNLFKSMGNSTTKKIPTEPLNSKSKDISTNESYSYCVICTTMYLKFPKICLSIDHLLSNYFSIEYGKGRNEDISELETIVGCDIDDEIVTPASQQLDQVLQNEQNSNTFFPAIRRYLQRRRARKKLPPMHFGVMCDGCGQYPLLGTRFQCQDCPEELGYDICGNCVESGVQSSGRFSQNHLPSHKLKKVKPEKTFIHEVRDANPEMDGRQIQSLFDINVNDFFSFEEDDIEIINDNNNVRVSVIEEEIEIESKNDGDTSIPEEKNDSTHPNSSVSFHDVDNNNVVVVESKNDSYPNSSVSSHDVSDNPSIGTKEYLIKYV